MIMKQVRNVNASSPLALSESLWTKTLKELLKYTIKAPYTYLSGLLILSEMLPLPLPIQTREVRPLPVYCKTQL